MSHAIVAAILVGHGLITSMIGFVAVTSPNAPAMALPSWFGWWLGPFGRSWLFEVLGFGVPASVIGGFVWLMGGLLIVAGGRAPAIARDGTLSFLRPDDMPIELVRMSRSGVIEAVTELADTRASMLTSGPLGTCYQQWGGVSVSPDASRVAVSVGLRSEWSIVLASCRSVTVSTV